MENWQGQAATGDNSNNNWNPNPNPQMENHVGGAGMTTGAGTTGSHDPSVIQVPNNNNNRITPVVVNEAGIKRAIHNNVYLYQNLLQQMTKTKKSVVNYSEQVMQQHQQTIEKMKFELDQYQKGVAQERNYWNTQRCRVESAIAEVTKSLQQNPAAIMQSVNIYGANQLWPRLLIKDYSWLDPIVEKTNPPETIEEWKRLKSYFQRWNRKITELSKTALVYMQVREHRERQAHQALNSPLLYSTLQGEQQASVQQYSPIQAPSTGALPNNPPSIPNGGYLPQPLPYTNHHVLNSNYATATSPSPGTSYQNHTPPAAAAGGYSQPQPQQPIQNYTPSTSRNTLNFFDIQDHVIRDMLNTPNTNTTMQISNTQIVVNNNNNINNVPNNSVPIQQPLLSNYNSVNSVNNSINSVQQPASHHQNHNSSPSSQTIEALHLKVQQRQLEQLRQQVELQRVQEQETRNSELLLRLVTSSNPSQVANTNTNPNPTVHQTHAHEASNSHAQSQTALNVDYQNPDPTTSASATDQDVDDDCTIIEEDPLAVSPSSYSNGNPNISSPADNQNEILTLAKARQLDQTCCSSIFEVETTEVINLVTEPARILESAITPPYSDASDQEHLSRGNTPLTPCGQTFEPPPNGFCLPNVSVAPPKPSTKSQEPSPIMNGGQHQQQHPPQKVLSKRNSTGSMTNNTMPKKRKTADEIENIVRSTSADANKRVPASVSTKFNEFLIRQAHGRQNNLQGPSSNEQTSTFLLKNINTFEDLGLDSRFVNGLKIMGFHQLRPIQKLGYPALLCKKELLVIGEMDSGKTTMALIGLVHRLHLERQRQQQSESIGLQAIYITPSLESAASIAASFNNFASLFQNFQNGSTTEERNSLKAIVSDKQVRHTVGPLNAQVLVGDPGRIKRFFQLRADHLGTKVIKYIVIDSVEVIKEDCFPVILGLMYSNYIKDDAQVIVLTRTTSTPGFNFLRPALRNPELITTIKTKPIPTQNQNGHSQIVSRKSSEKVSRKPSLPPISSNEHHEQRPNHQERQPASSPPVISIPETGLERTSSATTTAKFFVPDAVQQPSRPSLPNELNSTELTESTHILSNTVDILQQALQLTGEIILNETEEAQFSETSEVQHQPNTSSNESGTSERTTESPNENPPQVDSNSNIANSSITVHNESEILNEQCSTESPVPASVSVPAPENQSESIEQFTTEPQHSDSSIPNSAMTVHNESETRNEQNSTDSPATVPVSVQAPGRGNVTESEPEPILIPENLHKVQHFYCEATEFNDRVDTAQALASTMMIGQAYIFCENSTSSSLVSELKGSEGLACGVLHANMPESELSAVFQAFQAGDLKALILTDESSKMYKSQLKRVPFILNFDFPKTGSSYIYRSSFAGPKDIINSEQQEHEPPGQIIVLNFVNEEAGEFGLIDEIQKKYKISITDASSQDDDE